MYLQDIPENAFTTTLVKIKYDCNGNFERCGKEWTLKLKDAQKNFEKNKGKHKCRSCTMSDENPMMLPEIQEKVKKKNLEKYGATRAMNTKEKIEERVEKMFGTESSTQKIVEKRKQTSIERYGAKHIMQTDEGKKRLREAFQERYGVDHPMKTKKCVEKLRSTSLQRYGVNNPMILPEIQEKVKKTIMEKYGVEYYNQLPEMRDYLRENCPQWLKDSWENGGPNKGIARPEEWNDKQRETVTELMMLGLWKSNYPRSKKGFCYPKNKCKKTKVYFRSTYEAIYCYYLDNNPEVEWFSFESFRILYEFENKQRYYVPDFLIKWKNQNKISIIELKANFMKEDEQVKAKIKFANLFANNNNMEFNVLYCKDINDLNINFEEIKNIGFLEI